MQKFKFKTSQIIVWSFFLVGLITLALGYQLLREQSIKSARLDYLSRDFQPKQEKLERHFRLAYQTLRTVGLLPGIRHTTAPNRTSDQQDAVQMGAISQETYGSIQQLYNNLAKDVPVSEIYVVMDPLDPAKQIPLLMFDELILGDSKSETDTAQAEVHNPDSPEEYEGAEYQAYANKLEILRSKSRQLIWNNLDSIPAISTPEVRTCDNSQYPSRQAGNERESHGFAYSVPFYDQNNQLHGIVSTVIRLDPIEALLEGRDKLAITHADSAEFQSKKLPIVAPISQYVLFNTTTGLVIHDRHYQRSQNLLQDLKTFKQFSLEQSINNDKYFAIPLNIRDQGQWILALEWPADLAQDEIRSTQKRMLGFSLILFLIALASSLWLRNNQRQKEQILAAHHKIQGLLENLGQGVLPIDRNGKILPGCTLVAKELFGKDPEGLDLINLLQIPPAGHFSINSWLELVFDLAMPFEDLAPLGPQSFEKNGKVIRLEYRAIVDSQGKPETLLCLATDISRERKLQDEAAQEKERARMILGIFRDRAGFAEFVDESRQQLNFFQQEINRSNANIEALFRSMHTLKGLFASFHIQNLARMAHSIENSLDQLRREGQFQFQSKLEILNSSSTQLSQSFEEFLLENREILGDQDEQNSKSVQWDHILTVLDQLEHQNIDEAKGHFVRNFVLEALDSKFQRYQQALQQMAEKTGKSMQLEITKEGDTLVYAPIYQSFVASWIHVVRNVADHGIEAPDERILIGKLPTGQVKIHLKNINNERLQIELREDGRGIDPAFIRQKALEKGIISAAEIEKMDNFESLQLIFHPGFSTASVVTDTSGRGVGMEVLRHEARKLGGTTWVESEIGRGTRFFAEIPIYQEALRHRPVDLRAP